MCGLSEHIDSISFCRGGQTLIACGPDLVCRRPAFVNQMLLSCSYTHLVTGSLLLLLCFNGRVG